MTKTELLTKLAPDQLNACKDAVAWVESQSGSVQAMWSRCLRADWMVKYAAMRFWRTLRQHRRIVLVTCACVRTVLHHVRAGEDRPRLAIEISEKWARGKKVTVEQVRNAAHAAGRAGYTGASVSLRARATAHAAACVGYTVCAYARGNPTDAALDARAAVFCATGYGANRAAAFAAMAKIIRKFIPKVPQ